MREYEKNGRNSGVSKLVVALALVAFSLGYLVRPDSVTDGRVGYLIITEVASCSNWSHWFEADLPVKVYAAINAVLPLDMQTVAAWDALIFVLGVVSILVAATYFSSRWNLSFSKSVFLLAVFGLCGIYIFIFNKDVIQFFIFAFVFVVLDTRLASRTKLCITVAVFVCEFLLWRQYYAIVAVFVPCLYLLLDFIKRSSFKKNKRVLIAVFCSIGVIVMFAFALRAVSPENYTVIVEKHGSERESYTAFSAVSGIASLIEVSGSSPTPLFIANWVINVFRLMFPLELFQLGPYYWAFAIYQLYLTVSVGRSVFKSGGQSQNVILMASVYYAFLIASATFEPDFGSWVRHETAAFPIILYLICDGSPINKRMKDCVK